MSWLVWVKGFGGEETDCLVWGAVCGGEGLVVCWAWLWLVGVGVGVTSAPRAEFLNAR